MSDSSSSYRVVFWGGLILGQERRQVAKRFARQFKIRNPRQLQQLFSGRLLTLKSNLGYEDACRYSDAIRKMGAICRLELETNPLSAEYGERQRRAVETFKPSVTPDLRLMNAEELVSDSDSHRNPFAARDLAEDHHPPCKYFDARASSQAVKQAQKLL